MSKVLGSDELACLLLCNRSHSKTRDTMTMTVEEMGTELGVSRSTAYSLVQQPGFPSFAIGRRVLVSREGLQKWIERQCDGSGQAFFSDVEK